MMFDVPMEGVTADHRRIAKVLNFGVIYGLSPFGISQQTRVSPDEGRKFIQTYFDKYPGIQGYLDEVKERVKAVGYVETLLGHRRYIPEVTHPTGWCGRRGSAWPSTCPSRARRRT